MNLSVIERINFLVEKLNHYTTQYYQNDSSEISDFEFDKLLEELKKLEEENPQSQTSKIRLLCVLEEILAIILKL